MQSAAGHPKGKLVIYDLCGGSGAWSRPYAEDPKYHVVVVDLNDGLDVRVLWHPKHRVHGVLAAPPCTDLCIAGANAWERKGEPIEALAVVDACIRFAVFTRPVWWALENPAGRLTTYIGSPVMWFQPWEFGDPWTKRTGVWGSFTMPCDLNPVEPQGSIMDFAGTPAERSVTPSGFARAFYKANP